MLPPGYLSIPLKVFVQRAILRLHSCKHFLCQKQPAVSLADLLQRLDFFRVKLHSFFLNSGEYYLCLPCLAKPGSTKPYLTVPVLTCLALSNRSFRTRAHLTTPYLPHITPPLLA